MIVVAQLEIEESTASVQEQQQCVLPRREPADVFTERTTAGMLRSAAAAVALINMSVTRYKR